MDSGEGGPGSNSGAAIGSISQLVIKTPTSGVSANGSPIDGFTPTITWVSPNVTFAEPSALVMILGSTTISLLWSKSLPSALLPLLISFTILLFEISGTTFIFTRPIHLHCIFL